jgi:penicillin-binding protein 2
LYNRAISGLYPPGSTIKPIVAAAGLQEGVITPQTIIHDTGAIDVPHKYNPNIVYHFVGWNKAGLGPVNLFSALALSSDIYFYYVGGGYKEFQGLGVENLIKYYKNFGLGEKLGIDLPGEASGIIPTPEWKETTKHEEWYLGDTYHISIGQGDLLVTPLQVAAWTACIASNGKLFRPFLVKKIIDNNGNVMQESKGDIIREGFIKNEYIELVKKGMRETVLSGSAQSLSSLPYEIAGKTGTAQHGGSDKTHAWFAGFAPYDHPKVVILVLVEDGGEGSKVAVPIAGKILDWYFKEVES